MAMNTIDWEEDGVDINGRKLQSLEYADDIVVFARTRPQMERMMGRLADACAGVGLVINERKTVLLSSCHTRKQPMLGCSSSS